jgi:hypothetical protein
MWLFVVGFNISFLIRLRFRKDVFQIPQHRKAPFGLHVGEEHQQGNSKIEAHTFRVKWYLKKPLSW